MPDAKLIKSLEKKGFFLEFPDYKSNEELIIELLKEGNPRLNLALPSYLLENLDYNKITLSLNSKQKKELDKIILISEKIYKKEKIPNMLGNIIKQNKIKRTFSNNEFSNFYETFKETKLQINQTEQKAIEKQTQMRLKLDLNKSLNILFSPAKIRILSKIFNHEKLSNTELKYYYKSISNINKSVLNSSLQDYLRIIESTKKLIK
ncbi:MAG: hypothetical protein AABW91_01400 [Nanoarchaeota archaeon]